ncbi:MAG: BatA domain-containing protein [Pirellulaceae bacterium]
MGLLAPLYALAALAVVGPILFHLIRRQPKQHMQFSSLMFLSSSPPRLTRRSRLDNLLLLLLRALAIVLIAIAFARPYLRQQSFLNSTLTGRNIVVLLDTSASMQRDDIWKGAVQALRELIDSLSPEDRLALYTVDAVVTPIVPFEQDGAASPVATVAAVRAAISKLEPGWQRTELSAGLRSIADMLSAAAISGKTDAAVENKIVLISDLAADSGLDSLQGYPWPPNINLDCQQILPAVPGNARLAFMQREGTMDDSGDVDTVEPTLVKLRVENNRESLAQNFELTWADAAGPIAGTSTSVQVPAGQVRVVPIVDQPPSATHVQLLGDSWDGDNHAFAPASPPVSQRIAFLGPTVASEEQDLGYFLKKTPLSTPLVSREVVVTEVEQLNLLSDVTLKVVVVEPTVHTAGTAPALREFASTGGTVVVSLARAEDSFESSVKFLQTLCDADGMQVSEASVRDYALLSSIDYQHPVFAPFADPRFNDFSKLRFWNYRKLTLPETGDFRVIASYDDGSPMLIEQLVGNGRVWIMTTGWQPEASTLALSSKFVPILMGMLDPSGQRRRLLASFEVGERIEIAQVLPTMAGATKQNAIVRVMGKDGQEVSSGVAVVHPDAVEILQPGLFTLQLNELSRQIAVQVPASESQHSPLDPDIFAQYSIELGSVKSDAERRESLRQLQIEELEGKQRLWQWLIAAGLAVLGLETVLAGWQARQNTAAPTT